jgi:hypothetical protein
VLVGNSVPSEPDANRVMLWSMIQLLRLLCGALIGLFRSNARREAEILVLRHQINVLRRKSSNRPALNNIDRLLFVLFSRLAPTTLDALTVVRISVHSVSAVVQRTCCVLQCLDRNCTAAVLAPGSTITVVPMVTRL